VGKIGGNVLIFDEFYGVKTHPETCPYLAHLTIGRRELVQGFGLLKIGFPYSIQGEPIQSSFFMLRAANSEEFLLESFIQRLE